jgi:hypothetical protein
MEKIKHDKIAIVGAGGLGSHLAHFMWDFGYNRKQFSYIDTEITIYDDKPVSDKNLLHQNFSLDDLGKKKVTILAERYAIKPVTKLAFEKDLKKYDVVFSCVDNFPFRTALYEFGDKNPELFWIDGRSTSNLGMIFNSKIPKQIRDEYLDKEDTESGSCLYDYEKEQNISHTMPIIVAAGMMQIFLQATRGIFITKEKVFHL